MYEIEGWIPDPNRSPSSHSRHKCLWLHLTCRATLVTYQTLFMCASTTMVWLSKTTFVVLQALVSVHGEHNLAECWLTSAWVLHGPHSRRLIDDVIGNARGNNEVGEKHARKHQICMATKQRSSGQWHETKAGHGSAWESWQ